MAHAQGVFLHATDREAGTYCVSCRRAIVSGDPLSACRSCGGLHHAACWDLNGGCAAFACTPSRRTSTNNGSGPTLRISASDLEGVALTTPANARMNGLAGYASMDVGASSGADKRNGLAIAALVVSILGIIPYVGLLLGFVGLILGAVALGTISKKHQRGAGFAIAGILLGLLDMVFSSILIVTFLSGFDMHAKANLNFSQEAPSFEDLKDLPAPIQRAMLANVMVRKHSGWGGLQTAFGSGVVLSIKEGDALVITNRHVIDPAFAGSGGAGEHAQPDSEGLSVLMVGQPYTPARIEWVAPGGVDLALIRVPCRTKAAASAAWGRKANVNIGEAVFAVGNPQMLGWTHTQGAVSAFRTQTSGGKSVRVIQTQTAINQGNSGGGLYAGDGRLIGINTWTNDKSVSEGLSFAILFDSLLELSPPGLELPPDPEKKP